ncbi:uncharacterized protein LOC117340342 [Pecten maximus]|uniref:uncharacterized protein LOC117340342 n=1 Tax=Pecten maximus TaxID=6579 RepID=UPI001458E3C6|nr:uncharacterized protein LOC117340342 [Pecten maximus]
MLYLCLCRSVRSFYTKIVEKMCNKFPFGDPTMKDLGFLNPSARSSKTSDAVIRLIKRFPSLSTDENLQQLQDQFDDYMLSPDSDLPPITDDLDKFWGEMSKQKDVFCKSDRFDVLSKLAFALLSLPNSNADSERAFSMVRKITTDFRSDMNNDTLCALLSTKINCDSDCCDYQPSTNVLKMAKTATTTYNVKHSCK